MYLRRITTILCMTVSLLITDIRSVEVARGDTATIVCDIAGTFLNPMWDDGTTTFVYIAEAQTMFNPSTTDSRWSRSSDTKNLIISSIDDSDAGTYRCSITTPTTDSYTARLTVNKPTVSPLITDIRSVEVARGDTTTIVCDIAGTFVHPRWDDGTNTIYVAEGTSIFNPSTTDSRWARSCDTKNLIISSFEDNDAGTYRCSITTPTLDSYTARLTVNKPTVVTLTANRTTVPSGNAVTLTCKTTGSIDVDILFNTVRVGACTIFRDLYCTVTSSNYNLTANAATTEFYFTIRSFVSSNCGTYKCTDIGSIDSAEVLVEHELSKGDTCGICGQCSPSNLISCSASKTCECNQGYKENNCVPFDQYPDEAVSVLVVLPSVVLLILAVIIRIQYKRIDTAITIILWKNRWQLLLSLGAIVLVLIVAACGRHVHINTGGRDGYPLPWYIIASIILAILYVVAFIMVATKSRIRTQP